MLKEMVEEIKKNEEKATKLHEIINLIGGDCCLDNVVTRVNGIISDNPLNPSVIKAQLEDLQYDVNEAESEYSDKYSDIESAVSNLEYISSELDSLYNAQRGVNNLLQSIEDAEMDKKATEETTEENTEQ